MPTISADDDDPLCTCDHMDARPAHTLAQHAPDGGRCRGIDSFGLRCECPGFELHEPFRYDADNQR